MPAGILQDKRGSPAKAGCTGLRTPVRRGCARRQGSTLFSRGKPTFCPGMGPDALYRTEYTRMEEYDALARQMTSGEGDQKVYGCHYHTWRSAVSLFSILDGEHTIIDGSYDFMKPTYDMILAQQKDGICMDYGYLKTSSLHYSAAFENQQCAMLNMGSWFIATLRCAADG